MNVSRASRRRSLFLRAAVLTGALCAAGAGAVAQDGPISLFPPTVAPDQGPGEPPLRPDAADPARPAERAAETPSFDGIEIDRLGELDPEALGIHDLNEGGLGTDVWAGSARPRIEALLAGLSADIASPTLHSLVTRLLLTGAAPDSASGAPTMAAAQGDDGVQGREESAGGSGFLRLRAERLYDLGAVDGLNRLLALVPQRIEDSWLARARVDGLLLTGKDRQACAEVPAGLARFPQELYWAKAQIYCQFLAEQSDQALLGLDLLREQEPDGDRAFFTLANSFITDTAPWIEVEGLSPLNLAMLRRAGGSLPVAVVETAELPLLHGIAGLVHSDWTVQAAAIERLVEVGVLSGKRLAGAYAAFDFTEDDLADALARAEAADAEGAGVRARAMLYLAANRETLAATKAELLREALLSAEIDGRSNAVARALQPLFTGLVPSPELAWFAPLAARTLYRLGQFERAGAWLSVLRMDGLKHPESQRAYEALMPLRRLAGGSAPLKVESGAAESAAAAEYRLLMLVLSRSLGQQETLTWTQLARDDAVPAQPLERLPRLLALSDAAAEGRRGESVLLTVAALGAAAPAETHPLALGYAVSALAAVGLGNEARSLAIEAALAARL